MGDEAFIEEKGIGLRKCHVLKLAISFPSILRYFHASFLLLRSIFYNSTTGEPHPEGAIVKRPVLADTLQAVADGGAAVLYGGKIGKLLADDIQKNGGIITLQDLKDYRYGVTNQGWVKTAYIENVKTVQERDSHNARTP